MLVSWRAQKLRKLPQKNDPPLPYFCLFLSSHDKFLVGYVSGNDSIKTNVFESKLIDTSSFKCGHYQIFATLLYNTLPTAIDQTKKLAKSPSHDAIRRTTKRLLITTKMNGFIRQKSPLLLYSMRAFRRYLPRRLVV